MPSISFGSTQHIEISAIVFAGHSYHQEIYEMPSYISFLPLKNNIWTLQDEALLSSLPSSRRDYVNSYLFDADKRLSLYSALLLSHMLETHFGIADGLQGIHWVRGEKPFLSSFPDIDFNFSHTRNAILCGISSEGKIGVDIERCENAPFDIMPTVFHPEEIHYIDNTLSKKISVSIRSTSPGRTPVSVGSIPLQKNTIPMEHNPAAERERAFFELWTRKEAYTKTTGTGLLCDLTSTNTLTVPDVSFVKWEPTPYICTVCLEKPHPVNFHTSTEEIFQNLPDLTFE